MTLFNPQNALDFVKSIFIFKKRGLKMNDIITIQITDYLSQDLAALSAQAQWRSASPQCVNRIRSFNFDSKCDTDFFHVVATRRDGRLVGRLNCLQNAEDPTLWYYGDLFVLPEHRRAGIASGMVQAAAGHLRERGARTLRCYVEADNAASLALQRSLGFAERPWLPFDRLDNAGQIMFELDLPAPYSVVPYAEIDEPAFIMKLHRQNQAALHDRRVLLAEWREIMAAPDPDEAHFFVCLGCVPVAWLKLNGLSGTHTAWISTLAVGTRWHRRGAGRFAVGFAEEFLRAQGFAEVRIKTTQDNLAAQGLYTACGYRIVGEGDYRTGDGVLRAGYTFSRRLG